MKILCAILLSMGCFYSAYSQETITLNSLLQEMTDFDAVARFPSPVYTLRQASSYDRRSVSPDQPGWFANSDFNQFIREEKKEGYSEFVMMDVEGPGTMVRFWLTTLTKSGVLRIYFDNEPTASLEIPGFDLMKAGFGLGPALLNPHSSYEPEGKGGNTLYLPLPYQKHCKVTWQFADSANMKTPHYYQINYRTYSAGTKVTTFRREQLSRYRSAIDRTDSILRNPPQAGGKEAARDMVLSPGKEMAIALPAGAAAVRELTMSITTGRDEDREKMWRSVIIRIEFDGHPTVQCPLGDFIGSGAGGKRIKSWYRDLSDQRMLTSRWVMPYRKSATIFIQNSGAFDVSLHAKAVVSPFKWDNRTMYFHATYKFEKDIKDVKWDYDPGKVAKNDPAGPIDWNFVRIQGKGIYLGNTLCVDNHMKSWYGEGDAKAYVDGEHFPSEFGTGLEDYYNTSWAPVVLYQTPFANAPRADEPSSTGYNTFTRTRILDGIPFLHSFFFDMEMLSWDGGTIDAGATTYWYGTDTARPL
ncbi:MAG: DUF2961 domain-containing protein [Bacteroidetes bacterium]|nr:DUF2961 domain-containing protein [Bacteroidota bacterium]